LKLNPTNDQAWNALGEVMWKKKDYPSARKCFESAFQNALYVFTIIRIQKVKRHCKISQLLLNKLVKQVRIQNDVK
jgi:hypothetical protein